MIYFKSRSSPVYALTVYRRMELHLHLFVTSLPHGVSDKPHVSAALLPGRAPPDPIEEEVVWAPKPVLTV
jgi:hypothetical protein